MKLAPWSRTCFLSLVLLATAPHGAAAAAKVQPDSVAFSFAWKPGLRVVAKSSSRRTRMLADTTTRSATWSYEMRVAPEGDSLRIHFEDAAFAFGERSGATSTTPLRNVLEEAKGLTPDFWVTKSGEFRRIHDVAAYAGRVRAFIHKLLPSEADTTVLQGVQSLVASEPFLESAAAELWNALVSGWLGAKLELGTPYVYSAQQPIAVFPGRQVKMNCTFTVKRHAPCERAGSAHGCVEIDLRSVTDPDDMKQLIQAFLEKAVPGGASQLVIEALQMESHTRLVTEPDGLLPHRMMFKKSLVGTMSMAGHEAQVQQQDEIETDYTYP